MPISTQKVVILAGTAYAAYVVGDSLGLAVSGVSSSSAESIPDAGIVGHMSVGLSASTTRSFSGRRRLGPCIRRKFAIGTSIVAIEYDGLNLGTMPGTSTLPLLTPTSAPQGTLDADGQPGHFCRNGIHRRCRVSVRRICHWHADRGLRRAHAGRRARNLRRHVRYERRNHQRGKRHDGSAGDWIIAIAALNGTNGEWGVCAYAIPLANPSGPTAGPTFAAVERERFSLFAFRAGGDSRHRDAAHADRLPVERRSQLASFRDAD